MEKNYICEINGVKYDLKEIYELLIEKGQGEQARDLLRQDTGLYPIPAWKLAEQIKRDKEVPRIFSEEIYKEQGVSDVNSEKCTFEFECGSFHEGRINYKIYQGEDKCRIVIRGFRKWPPYAEFFVLEEEIESLKLLMSGLKWEKSYFREGIFDGYGWNLKGWGAESSGYAAYPEGYDAISYLIESTFIRLHMRYDPLMREEVNAMKKRFTAVPPGENKTEDSPSSEG